MLKRAHQFQISSAAFLLPAAVASPQSRIRSEKVEKTAGFTDGRDKMTQGVLITQRWDD